ncbi:hypothetical protein F4778DRAFT_20873 [Xylariomycetidae sp. FL2044]|nr:hypothetical protein F4778DRAFT_20873 [Xylariomycetidae sp. FL2044]
MNMSEKQDDHVAELDPNVTDLMDVLHIDQPAGWPSWSVPLELLVYIAQHLDRKDLGSMRLVNREFNAKLSSYYLRHLVLHFGPKVCTVDTGLPLQGWSRPIDVTSRLRQSFSVFDNFGTEIRRFGLSLDMTEYDLVTPNVQMPWTIEVRDWGIYRWPLQETSYEFLDNIMRSLNSSSGIFNIMRQLKQVKEFALSCNGLLGYLNGPDVNASAPSRLRAVFGDPHKGQIVQEPAAPIDFDTSWSYDYLIQGLLDAGVKQENVESTAATLLTTQGIQQDQLTHEFRERCPLPGSNGTTRYRKLKCDCCKGREGRLRIQPDMLTDAQKRLLLQCMSVHQVLIQSFTLAIVNRAPSFQNLTTIKIASIPSFHLHLLLRHSIWSIQTLEEVSLAVIPDWRHLNMRSAHWIEENQVYPTSAMPKVFQLLHEYIGIQKHIKRLHFEWLCGGELAPGHLHRNRDILPAPFLKDHRKVMDSSPANLLILPYITSLSLKNCWFTPHVFFRIVRAMATINLDTLELETVSLSGPPNELKVEDSLLLPPPSLGILPLRQPRNLSWAHVIDMLTPGETIRERICERDYGYSPNLKKHLKLRRLIFKSCGYVFVPDQRFISSHRFTDALRASVAILQRDINGVDLAKQVLDRGVVRTLACFDHFAQVSTDRHLASITKSDDRHEELAMKVVFGLRYGWKDFYDQDLIELAKEDGIPHPGNGRFSGTIEHNGEPTPSHGHNDVSHFDYPPLEVENYSTARWEYDYDDTAGLELLISQFETGAHYTLRKGPAIPTQPPDPKDELVPRH